MNRKTCLIIATFGALAACHDNTPTSLLLTPVAPALSVTWNAPEKIDALGVSALNTTALEGCPHESVDGQTLFFASDRAGNLDIWVSERGQGGEWGTPERLPEPVNSTANDFCPTPQPGGGLLLVSTRADLPNCGAGKADIYETHRDGRGNWSIPQNLGCTVNSTGNEFSPALVSAAGGMLFFSSDRNGKHELFMSTRDAGGSWSSPDPVAELNYAGSNTARPNVSQDGREIVFDSDRPGGAGAFDIWRSSRASVMDAWSAPANVSVVNSSASETRPTFSRDGKRLYFGSTRDGTSDIFMAIR